MGDIMPDKADDTMPKVPSHPIALADIPKTRPRSFRFAPDADARREIAQLLDAQSVSKFLFEGQIENMDDGSVLLQGELGASVTQACVVTLGPVKTRIDSPVRRHFITDYSLEDVDHQILPEDDENLEAMTDPIDVAAIAIEAVALALPDYPRADDAGLEKATFAEPGIQPLEDADLKPFASLEALREKLARQKE